MTCQIDDEYMMTKDTGRVSRTLQDQIDKSIEAAVSRLAMAGNPREDALESIHAALQDVVSRLSSVGVGDVSRLRRQLMSASKKLAAARAGGSSPDRIEAGDGA